MMPVSAVNSASAMWIGLAGRRRERVVGHQRDRVRLGGDGNVTSGGSSEVTLLGAGVVAARSQGQSEHDQSGRPSIRFTECLMKRAQGRR